MVTLARTHTNTDTQTLSHRDKHTNTDTFSGPCLICLSVNHFVRLAPHLLSVQLATEATECIQRHKETQRQLWLNLANVN